MGARRANLEITDSGPVIVQGIASLQAGDVGLRCLNCRDLLIDGSVIDGALNHGLDIYNCTRCLVENNRVANTGLIAGMGRSGNGQYNGVRFGGFNAVFRRNEVIETGVPRHRRARSGDDRAERGQPVSTW